MRFDFIIHWLWTLVFLALTISGLGMTGAKYSWILNYDIALADLVHRLSAAIYVALTFVSISFEVMRSLTNETKKMAWFVFGPASYQVFTMITTLIFIITGTIIWICMDANRAATAFALFIHEKLTFIVIASLLWHIYVKAHALVWPRKKLPTKGKTSPKEAVRNDAESMV